MHAVATFSLPSLALDTTSGGTATWRWLSRIDHGLVVAHLLGLTAEDRRLRFGLAMADDGLVRYAESLWQPGHAALGVLEDGELLAMGHVAGDGLGISVEIGLSVAARARRRGLGGLLLEEALQLAAAWGLQYAEVYFRSDNRGMARLCAKWAARIESDAGERVATFVVGNSNLPPPVMQPFVVAPAPLVERVRVPRRRHWVGRTLRRALRWTRSTRLPGLRHKVAHSPKHALPGSTP